MTTQATNNGVGGFYDYYTEEGNVLTIDSAVIGYCSYQEENFSASDHVEKLIPKFELNKYIGLFLVTIINQNQFKFSYGRKCNQKQIGNIEIELPVDNADLPDWTFMENYIKKSGAEHMLLLYHIRELVLMLMNGRSLLLKSYLL